MAKQCNLKKPKQTQPISDLGIPFKIFCDRVLFLAFIIRLFKYFIDPNIKDEDLKRNPLGYALLDVFTCVGFITALTIGLMHIQRYEYLSIVKALNIKSFIYIIFLGALIMASAFCALTILLARLRKLLVNDTLRTVYYLWLHCLRFYSVMIIIIFAFFYHMLGLIVSDGEMPQAHIREHLFAYWVVIAMCTWVVLRLFINPVMVYLPIVRRKWAFRVIILIMLTISIGTSHVLPVLDHTAIFDEGRCKEVFENTKFYNRLPDDIKKNAEGDLCGNNKHL